MRRIPCNVCGLGFKVTDSKAYDFEAIEAAVMETERGRWFLAEFARRHKNADTETLLAAIHRLETAIGEHVPSAGGDALARELSAMATALKATETEMRQVSSEWLADGGAVPEGRTAFADVGVRARNLAAGLNATTEALKSASDDLRQDPSTAEHLAGLDDDLSRLAEHSLTQNVLSQRIGKAMDLISHLQDRIQASLDAGEQPQSQASEDSPAPEAAPAADETLSAGEVSYFDADRELFAPPEAAPAPAPELAADDPENAPHLADMLEDALASMQVGGDAGPAATEAAEASEADAPAPAPPQPDMQPAETLAHEAPSAVPPAAAADEEPGEDEAPKTRRVVIVREPPAAVPPPAPSQAEAGPQSPCRPCAPEDAQAAASDEPEAPVAAEPEAPVYAQPEAPVAEEPEAPVDAQPDQAAPASGSEEEGPEAIMKMFAEAAARHGMPPAAADSEAEAAAPAPDVEAAPLEPMTAGPEERRRIVVIRRGSSADTHIPLEDSENGGSEAEA